jgi:hypothetical protein
MINKNVLFFSAEKVPLTYKGQWSPVSGELPSTVTYDNGTLLRVSVDGFVESVYYKSGSFIFNNAGVWQQLNSYDYEELINKPSFSNLATTTATTEGLAFATYVSSNQTSQNTLLSYLGATTLGRNIFRASSETTVLNLLGLPNNLVAQINSKQPQDADLTSIAALSGSNGILRKVALNTWTLDTTTYLTANQTINVSGAATGSGTTNIVLTLTNSGVTDGTYAGLTVNNKGIITSATNLTTLEQYGITDATPLSHVGSGSTAHSVASGSAAGFMSPAHFTKLENVNEDATENETDTYLLDRTNHTGAQAQSTITGLDDALAAKFNNSSVVQDLSSPSTTTVLSTQALAAELADLEAGQLYLGEWNSETNTPTIVSSTGTEGNYYVVSVGSVGETTIDGNDNWPLGGEIIFSGGVWLYKPTFNLITSVNDQTGIVVITKASVGLPDADNTSDVNKPISGPQQTAFNLKEDLTNKATSFAVVNDTLYPSVQAITSYLSSENYVRKNTTFTPLEDEIVLFTAAGTIKRSNGVIGTAAFRSATINYLDVTDNNVLTTGWLNLGKSSTSLGTVFTTFNDVPRLHGLTASVNLNAGDRPYVSATNFVVKVELITGGLWIQKVSSSTTTYYRTEVSGIWTVWAVLFDSRNILNIGLTDVSARAALNLGTASLATLATSVADTTAGRVIINGSGGINGPSILSGDLNSVAVNGFYRGSTGTPLGDNPHFMQFGGANSNDVTQFGGVSGSATDLKFRKKILNVWQPVYDIWHSGNTAKITSLTDSSANRFTTTGYAGLGAAAIPVTDFSSASLEVRNGFIAGSTAATTNRPSGVTWNVGLNLSRVNINAESAQIVIGTDGNTGLHYRARYNVAETYFDWRTVYDSGNVQAIAKSLFNATTTDQARISLGFGTGALQNASITNTALNLVQRTSEGYIYTDFINTDIPQTNSATVTDFYVGRNSDGFIYKVSPSYARTGLGLGDAATATLPSIGAGANDFEVSKYLRWRHHVNSHVIFDASSSLSPTASAINNSNPTIAWQPTYPTIMGWNGTQTYGVKVDRSRNAENALTLNGDVASEALVGSTLVKRQSNGFINVSYINTDITQENSGAVTSVYVAKNGENFIYKVAPEYLRVSMNAARLTGETFTGKVTVQFNAGATPNYSNGQMELRSTNGNPVLLGFHRSGHTACALIHASNGLILADTSFSGRANFEAAAFTGTTGTFTGNITANSFSGNGASLTNLNAGNISAGTVAGARLPQASTSGAGIVQLDNSPSGSSTSTAPTSFALSIVENNLSNTIDLANEAGATANSAYNLATSAVATATTANNNATSALTSINQLFTRPNQVFVNAGNVSGTWNISASNGTHYMATVTGNLTLNFTDEGLVSGRVIAFSFELHNVGNFTLTLPAGTRRSNGAAPLFRVNQTGIFVMTKCFGQNWRLITSDLGNI